MSTSAYIVNTRAVDEALRALDAAIQDVRNLTHPARVYLKVTGEVDAGLMGVIEVENVLDLYVVYEPEGEKSGGRPILDDLLARTLAGLRWTRTTVNQVFLDDHETPNRFVITRRDEDVTLTLHAFKAGKVCDPHVTVSAHDQPVVHALFAVAMATGKAREGARVHDREAGHRAYDTNSGIEYPRVYVDDEVIHVGSPRFDEEV